MKAKNYDRDEIITALRRFDESAVGETFDNMDIDELYERLDATSKVFSADDLILAAKLGF